MERRGALPRQRKNYLGTLTNRRQGATITRYLINFLGGRDHGCSRLRPSPGDEPLGRQLGGDLAHGTGLDTQLLLQLLLGDLSLLPEDAQDLLLPPSLSQTMQEYFPADRMWEI